MNTTVKMKSIKKEYVYVAIAVILIAALYAATNFLVNKKLADLQSEIKNQITEQQKNLKEIAETTSGNNADAITETVVRDCNVTERTQFDTLLGRLDKGLSAAELKTLENLFGRCGGFYAERKAVMVLRLTREIEMYQAQVEQLKTLTDEKSVEGYNVDGWISLSEAEKKQSEMFTKMVQQQDEIIKTLIAGKRADSAEMKAVLAVVKETQESLFVANKQAADLRATLVSQ